MKMHNLIITFLSAIILSTIVSLITILKAPALMHCLINKYQLLSPVESAVSVANDPILAKADEIEKIPTIDPVPMVIVKNEDYNIKLHKKHHQF